MGGAAYFTVTPENLPEVASWVFNHPFFFTLNVLMGGNWPGSPDSTTAFPARMLVDYVRVSPDAALEPPPGQSLQASITISDSNAGPNWQAIARVKVTDSTGSGVSSATVRGAWSGLTTAGGTEKVTNANGVALLHSGRTRERGTITFTITDIVKPGFTYVPPPEGDPTGMTR